MSMMSHIDQTPVVEVRNVARSFSGTKAVDGVSLKIAPGEIFGLLASTVHD